MKNAILPLVLASIAGLMYSGDESLAGTQEPEDKELQALLEARRDTLKEVLAIIKVQMNAGQDSIFELSRANTLLLEAELEAASSQQEAIESLERALKLSKATLGPEHPRTLKRMSGLAMAYTQASKPDLAVPLAEETLARQKQYLGPNHRDTLATMSILAVAYFYDTDLEAALLLIEKTLALQKQHLGAEHPDTRNSMGALAVLYSTSGKLDLAQSLLEETFKLNKATLGSEHPDTLGVMHIREKTQPDHWSTFSSQSVLGAALLGQQKYAEAEPLLITAYEGLKKREATIPPQGQDRLASSTAALQVEDPELRALREARRDVLKEAVEILGVRFREGGSSPNAFIAANVALLEAELELAGSKEERVHVLQQLLEQHKELEQRMEEMSDLGVGRPEDYLTAKAARLKAEIELHKAKKAE